MVNAEATQLVSGLIAQHKVLLFVKSKCPICAKTRQNLETLILPGQYEAFEIDKRTDIIPIQDALGELTGSRYVPRVFINGQFIGGGQDVEQKLQSGELRQLLQNAGVLA